MIKRIAIFLAGIFLANNAFATMTDLGALNSDSAYSRATAVSSDGSVIVGYSGASSNNVADGLVHQSFTYSNGVMTELLSTSVNNAVHGISADGAATVGEYYTSGDGGAINLNTQTAIYYDSSSGILSLDDPKSVANAISDNALLAVGASSASTNKNYYRAFVVEYPAGDGYSIRTLGTFGGNDSYATDVVNNGTVVGYAANADGVYRAFKYLYYDSTPSLINLGTLGGNSYAYGVSDDGSIIVGKSELSLSGAAHAVTYMNGSVIDLGTLGGTNSQANAISGDGLTIVGKSDVSGNGSYHAFRYFNNKMFDLGTLGGANSEAFAVSQDGSVIVGESQTSSGVTHAFVYRGSLIDINNTNTAVAINAAQTNSLINLNNTLLLNALDQDVTLFGKNKIGMSLGARYATTYGSYLNSVSDSQISSADRKSLGSNMHLTASVFKLAYKFSPKFRAGLFLDQSITNTMPTNFVLQNSSPVMGAFATYTARKDQTGFQLHLSGAYSYGNLTVKRFALDNTENGIGKTKLSSYGALMEAAYGFKITRHSRFQPYLGVREVEATRNAYTEDSNSANFPLTYDAVRRRATTGFAGARITADLGKRLQFRLSGGYEHDFVSTMTNYKGNIDALGAFNVLAPKIRKNRAVASAGTTLKLTKYQDIAFDVYYSQAAFNNQDVITGYLRYDIGF